MAAIGSGEVTTAAGLADRLLDASGLPALRAEIADRFTRRRDLLKARHALLTTRQVALASGDGELLREVERVLDGAHEFAELRVLNALRKGGLELGEARIVAARRLLGEAGTDVDARLGLDAGVGSDALRAVLVDQLAMWQHQAEHPLAGPDTAAAARVLVRTCEGLLAVTAIAETA